MSDSRKPVAPEVRALCLQCCGSGFFAGHLCDGCDGHGFELIVEVEMIRPRARARAKQAKKQLRSKAA
jgi:DnaJ-class molecular chaperone